ncbi:ABC transporter permease, partial [Corynebacterium gottingense]
MFVGLREIGNAKGRFGLIIGVVGLITLLVVMLTGLTAGLGKQNTSALEALNPHSVVFKDMEEPSYTTSRVGPEDAQAGDVPLGTGQTLLSRADGTEESVAILGLPEGTRLPNGEVVGTDAIASESLGLTPGEELTVGGAPVTVGSTADDLEYSHSPVLWVPTRDWQAAMHTDAEGTVLLASDDRGMKLSDSFNALPAYGSERGSLLMIQGFLYAIAALVIVAFLTVWTMQRTRDLAILKAIGAS